MKNNKFLIVILSVALCLPGTARGSQSWSNWYNYIPTMPSFSGLQDWATSFINSLSEDKIKTLLGAIVAVMGIRYVRQLLQFNNNLNSTSESGSESIKITPENFNSLTDKELFPLAEVQLFATYAHQQSKKEYTLPTWIVYHFISHVRKPYKYNSYINWIDNSSLKKNAIFYAQLLQEEGRKRSHKEILGKKNSHYKGYLMTYQYLENIGNALAKITLQNDPQNETKKKILTITNEAIIEQYRNYKEAINRSSRPLQTINISTDYDKEDYSQ